MIWQYKGYNFLTLWKHWKYLNNNYIMTCISCINVRVIILMIIPFHMTVLPGKVLIAYDEPEIVKGISHYLKNKGYFVTVAKEHTIAIDKARHF